MLAKAIRNRAPDGDVGQDFRARVTYICAKATAVHLGNLAGTWPDAAFQMRVSAGLHPRLRAPVYHLVLTWAETEQPSDAEVIAAARRVVADLGARAHQHVIAVHRDRVNIHAHVVLNRVHPVTGASLSLSHDYARLERACRQVEHAMGWPADRGRFDCVIAGDGVGLIPKPAAHWAQKIADRERGLRPDGRAARGHERRSGLPALRDAIPQAVRHQLRKLISAASGWPEVHLILGMIGLRYLPHGSGAGIVDPGRGWFMAASQLGAAVGLHRLQERLGSYTPDRRAERSPTGARDSVVFDPVLPPGHAQDAPLRDLVRGIAVRHQQIGAWRKARTDARRNLAELQAQEARQVRQQLEGRRSPFARALRQVMREAHRAKIDRLKQQEAAPIALPCDAMSDIIRHAPGSIMLRRYRHVLRHREDRAASGRVELREDHTSHRQNWVLARGRDDPRVPDSLAAILARHTDDMRADGSGRLLLARRNPRGSITGYEALQLVEPQTDHRIAEGSGMGLGLVGPRTARTCAIVADAAAALMLIATASDHDTLVIVTGHFLSTQSAAHLRRLSQGRDVFIAIGQDTARSEIRRQLSELLPQAQWRKRDPGDYWYGTTAAKAADAERGQNADPEIGYRATHHGQWPDPAGTGIMDLMG